MTYQDFFKSLKIPKIFFSFLNLEDHCPWLHGFFHVIFQLSLKISGGTASNAEKSLSISIRENQNGVRKRNFC